MQVILANGLFPIENSTTETKSGHLHFDAVTQLISIKPSSQLESGSPSLQSPTFSMATTFRAPSTALLRAILRPTTECCQTRQIADWTPRERYKKVTKLDKLHKKQKADNRIERKLFPLSPQDPVLIPRRPKVTETSQCHAPSFLRTTDRERCTTMSSHTGFAPCSSNPHHL